MRGLGLAVAWVGGLGSVLGIVTYGVADHPPRWKGQPLVLDLEIRTPKEHSLVVADSLAPMVSLQNGVGRSVAYRTAEKGDARREQDRWVVPMSMALASSSPSRSLWIRWDDGLTLTAGLPLRAKPTEADFGWSDWLETRVADRKDGWAAEGVEVDFRG